MALRTSCIAIGAMIATSFLASGHTWSKEFDDAACVGERGAAFGLCLAFCSALDCDARPSRVGNTACGRLENLYVRMTGMQPPCVRATCPCPAFDVNLITSVEWEGGNCSTFTSTGSTTDGETLTLLGPLDDQIVLEAEDSAVRQSCEASGLIDDTDINEFETGLSQDEVDECRRIIRESAQRTSGALDFNSCILP